MSSKIVRAAARIASRFTLGIGAAGVVGGIMADLFGWDIGTITGGQILPWAIIVFVIGITATIFRHELLLQEVDLLAGNPALRSLYEDGILPTIHDYFNYVRRGDIGIVRVRMH